MKNTYSNNSRDVVSEEQNYYRELTDRLVDQPEESVAKLVDRMINNSQWYYHPSNDMRYEFQVSDSGNNRIADHIPYRGLAEHICKVHNDLMNFRDGRREKKQEKRYNAFRKDYEWFYKAFENFYNGNWTWEPFKSIVQFIIENEDAVNRYIFAKWYLENYQRWYTMTDNSDFDLMDLCFFKNIGFFHATASIYKHKVLIPKGLEDDGTEWLDYPCTDCQIDLENTPFQDPKEIFKLAGMELERLVNESDSSKYVKLDSKSKVCRPHEKFEYLTVNLDIMYECAKEYAKYRCLPREIEIKYSIIDKDVEFPS